LRGLAPEASVYTNFTIRANQLKMNKYKLKIAEPNVNSNLSESQRNL